MMKKKIGNLVFGPRIS